MPDNNFDVSSPGKKTAWPLSYPLVGLCAFVVGCAGSMNDPAGKHVYDRWVTQAGWTRNPPDVGDADQQVTSSYVFQMKAVKDYEFSNYVTNLRRGTSWGEFGSDSVKIILDSLVAVTGGTETKAALGAASAGVTGATSSIKKNVLFDQSITTFITKMDTLRLEKWNQILLKWKGSPGHPPSESYTVAEAFDDLQEYGRCGTLDAALRDVAAKTNADNSKAIKANEEIKKIPSIDDILKNKKG